ncbi:MAG: hypothetical protein LBK25_09100, partial [Treponema sp.]|nr:hypothetical protein [Treponema sp.]
MSATDDVCAADGTGGTGGTGGTSGVRYGGVGWCQPPPPNPIRCLWCQTPLPNPAPLPAVSGIGGGR